MNIDNLTYGELKEIANIFRNTVTPTPKNGLNDMVGRKVIIRTCSAGVHYGTLALKDGVEVILEHARRVWKWKTKKGISLSSVAKHGLDQKESKLDVFVDSIWLCAIEIIPCTKESIESIEGAEIDNS